MNYRHAFHAGNFADCHKHAVLVWMLRAMARKDKPFLAIDTHAGIGRYDLAGNEALRTGEASRGIMRLLDDPPEALADYLGLVQRIGLYPGSPALIGALLRPGDRAIACELHPGDYAILRNRIGRHPQIGLHLRDGYEAVGAFLPAPEHRALLLIDPPYEQPDEYGQLIKALRLAVSRMPQVVAMAWYPIKHRAPVRALHEALRASRIPDIMAVELFKREPLDPTRLNGSGLVVINPPYRFAAELPAILTALLERLGEREAGEGTAMLRIAEESGQMSAAG